MLPIYTFEQALVELENRLKQHASSHGDPLNLAQTVHQIIESIRLEGDTALHRWASHWGDPTPTRLSPQVCESRVSKLSASERSVIEFAANNIRAFATAVMSALKPVTWEQSGATMGMDFRPIERVGCYVPGGRYPLPSSALMTALSAQVAGVRELVLVSPNCHPATIYAGQLAGVQTFIEVGGAQALAALAFGTETIPQVDMVVGPGNAAVVEAKRQLLGIIGIDMLAGPSEVLTLADETANADWVALDLLAQAEHDPDARAYLLTDSLSLAEQVALAVPRWHTELQLPAFVLTSLQQGGLYVLPSLDACVMMANRLAPEHLEVMTANPMSLKPSLTQYGALFLGMHTSVPFGDYAAGPNHTLPTARAARFSGALSPLTFLRPQTWLSVGSQAQQLASVCHQFATMEGLTAHAASIKTRFP